MNNWLNQIANDPRVRQVRENMPAVPPGVQRAATIGATGVAVGVTAFAIPPLLGFTTAGVAAGSIAAGIQSAFYGGAVSSGSAFAIMQSIGATGTIVPALFAGIGATAGAAVATEGGNPPDGASGHQPNNEAGDNNADQEKSRRGDGNNDAMEAEIFVADLGSSDDEVDNISEGSGERNLIRRHSNVN